MTEDDLNKRGPTESKPRDNLTLTERARVEEIRQKHRLIPSSDLRLLLHLVDKFAPKPEVKQ